VKPPPFDYSAPATVDEVCTSLAAHGEEAKVLAGGQSLLPLLNFRLVRPSHLIDLNRIDGLAYLRPGTDGTLAIGAMTRQRTVERSDLCRERFPLLVDAIRFIGHFQIRNRGTVGGSLAHADPAAELPAVLLALDGVLVARNGRGERTLPAAGFFAGALTTVLRPDELLVEVRLPATPPGSGHAFLEVSRRHGDFALVAVAVTVTLDPAGVCTRAAVALAGVGGAPVRVKAAEDLLVGTRLDAAGVEEAGRRTTATVEPDSDLHASAEYRKRVAGVLTVRALGLAARRARGGG
jgi:carbon-monoxide dehydrogenase medium subunit